LRRGGGIVDLDPSISLWKSLWPAPRSSMFVDRTWARYDGDEATRTIVRELVEHHGLKMVVSGNSHASAKLRNDVIPP
jgi:hypothetical protein